MSGSLDKLFSPFTFNGLTVPNRIAMAPMTRQFSPGETPGEDVATYYRRRAEGGTGLIITEGTTVADPVATMAENVPAFHGEALKGWKRVVEEVHDAGGLIAPQLWHVGTMRDPGKAPRSELPSAGPSGLFKPGKKVSEPMSKEHIQSVVDAFGRAAADARELGFDAIELHGAHGYLIDQFFWAGTNERDDEYGGEQAAQRTKFAVDIINAVRREVGHDYPLILRFSQWKQQDFEHKIAPTPDELAAFLKPLSDAGVDMFHCSTRRFWEPEFEGSDLNLAGWTKKLTGKPTMTVGSVGLSGEFIGAFMGESSEPTSIDKLLDRLEKDEFDMVAVGRALLVDPEWPNKIREGRSKDLVPFTKEALAALA
ncbi:NADH:flavin oxidoreductase/NADH oxidase [Tepidicaulis marinus]|jgi:2,4-dienoyl-CoA reductase-like NADH-dependent reductase (Old Yellow Enzyme family)|uniref:NADH:flavin oxidoreductase/NADH oxidase n=1 Tax=Tepidicaulis marinus TaxID=1333998 RepID=A0A081B7B2_9HYPH|nr:NADH:flavin oxidoreductase [Tepidicaulis marinus]GAK43930.1 NADH:flavin oxidoreductase/NADH oxidase [Tepidicaulis marinus]